MKQTRSKFGNWFRNSITARMLIVGFLLLVLLIPLQFVKSLIQERALRQSEVVNEINEKWGNDVILSGPIIKIPYKTCGKPMNLGNRIFLEMHNDLCCQIAL